MKLNELILKFDRVGASDIVEKLKNGVPLSHKDLYARRKSGHYVLDTTERQQLIAEQLRNSQT